MACLFPCVAVISAVCIFYYKSEMCMVQLGGTYLKFNMWGTEAGGDWGQLELKIETQDFGCWFLFVCLLVFIDRVSLSRIHK